MVDDSQTAASASPQLVALPPTEGLQRIVAQQQQQLTGHYTLFMQQGGEEALHDFRVSLRRLRSQLRNYRAYIKCDKALRQQLRLLQRLTNPVRDLEVFFALLRHSPPVQPRFMHELERELQQAYQQLRQELPAAWGILPSELTKSLQFPPIHNYPTLGTLCAAAGRRQLKKLNRGFRSLHRVWDEAQLHQQRIEAKRLRYLLEPFVDYPPVHTAIEIMKQFQDELGEYRDRQLLLHYLQDLQDLPQPESALITALQARLQLQGQALRRFQTQEERKALIKPLRSALEQLDCDR